MKHDEPSCLTNDDTTGSAALKGRLPPKLAAPQACLSPFFWLLRGIGYKEKYNEDLNRELRAVYDSMLRGRRIDWREQREHREARGDLCGYRVGRAAADVAG
jgi:hypothetical protein